MNRYARIRRLMMTIVSAVGLFVSCVARWDLHVEVLFAAAFIGCSIDDAVEEIKAHVQGQP